MITLSDKVVNIGAYNYIEATARITDIESKETECVTAYAREADSKKGMDSSQITGSTSSYARKYCLNGLLLIDDTKDADSQDNRPTKTEQVKDTFKATEVKKPFSPDNAKNSIRKLMNDKKWAEEEQAIINDMMNEAKTREDFASIYNRVEDAK